MSIPSKYFEKKSRQALEAERAKDVMDSFSEEKADDDAIADEMIRQDIEELDMSILESSVHESPVVAEFKAPNVIRMDDPTLTDDEKMLTELQLKFAWEYSSDPTNATRAAIRAGYSKASASKEASKCLRNEKVQRVIKARMPAQKRIMRMGKEFLLEGYAEIYNRCMQNVPVLDREGNPTGYYAFDANAAKNALDGISKIIINDPEKSKDDGEGSSDKTPISISSISDKIRGLK